METAALSIMTLVSALFIGLVFGGAIVFFFRRIALLRQLRIAQRRAARTVAEARLEAKDVLSEAREGAEKVKSTAEGEYRERRSEVQRQENRLSAKTEPLDRR